jgi:hypothetical protein
MKIKLPAHIYYHKYSWQDKGEFQILYAKVHDNEDRTYVCEQVVEVEVPDNYDPRAQQIAALKKEKQKVMAEFTKTVTEINDRISKLQALEYTA